VRIPDFYRELQPASVEGAIFCPKHSCSTLCGSPFEEISSCMFRHELAPLCKHLETCKIMKCQFSHKLNDDTSNASIEDSLKNLEKNKDDANEDYDDNEDDNDNPSDLGHEANKKVLELDSENESGTKPIRCSYGLCDLHNIWLASEKDFEFHLEDEHGFDEDD
jgi:hypothetical protein